MTSSSGGRSRNSSFEHTLHGRVKERIAGGLPYLQGVQKMETVHEPLDGVDQKSRVARREFLRLGAIGGAAVAAGAVASTWMPDLRKRGLLSSDGLFDAASIAWADVLYVEEFPTSPLILSPFTDPLPIPKALAPEQYVDWTNWIERPGAGDRSAELVWRAPSALVRRCAASRGRRLRWCTRSS